MALINLVTENLLASAFVGGCAVVFVLWAIETIKIGVIAIGFMKFSAGSLKMGSTASELRKDFWNNKPNLIPYLRVVQQAPQH